jgi:hypothetical protein
MTKSFSFSSSSSSSSSSIGGVLEVAKVAADASLGL